MVIIKIIIQYNILLGLYLSGVNEVILHSIARLIWLYKIIQGYTRLFKVIQDY